MERYYRTGERLERVGLGGRKRAEVVLKGKMNRKRITYGKEDQPGKSCGLCARLQ